MIYPDQKINELCAEIGKLKLELTAAYTRGAEGMRERAAREAEQPRFGSHYQHENRQAVAIAIRALPITPAPGGEK